MYTVLCHRFLPKCILGYSIYVLFRKYYDNIWNTYIISLGWSREGMTDADGDTIDADSEYGRWNWERSGRECWSDATGRFRQKLRGVNVNSARRRPVVALHDNGFPWSMSNYIRSSRAHPSPTYNKVNYGGERWELGRCRIHFTSLSTNVIAFTRRRSHAEMSSEGRKRTVRQLHYYFRIWKVTSHQLDRRSGLQHPIRPAARCSCCTHTLIFVGYCICMALLWFHVYHIYRRPISRNRTPLPTKFSNTVTNIFAKSIISGARNRCVFFTASSLFTRFVKADVTEGNCKWWWRRRWW